MIRKTLLQEKPIIITQRQTDFRTIEMQCDACPAGISMKFADRRGLSNFNYLSSDVRSIPLDKDFHVIYGTHLTSSPLVLNQSALSLLGYFKQPQTLSNVYEGWQDTRDNPVLESFLNKMVEFHLIYPSAYSKPNFLEMSDILTALLYLTTSCNLDCDYCHINRNASNMSLSTGYDIIDTLFRSVTRYHFQALKLKYTGGEPLLCFSTTQMLHHYAAKLAEKHGIELQGVILSNGTLLTIEIIKTIKALNLRLMVSLDGVDDYHNCHRRFPDGKSSFEAVSSAIDLALLHGLTPDISITVSSRNVEGLPELMEWILARNLPFSLNFYREHERSQPHQDLALDEERIIVGMQAAYRVIESRLPCRSLLASLVDRANLAMPHVRPCSVGRSYMVFDCEGNIFKCQMQMNKPIADIHVDDPLTLLQSDTIGIQNIIVDEKEECNTCQWKYWCAGGCPLATFRATGRYDVKSPNCNIYKALYPEVLRLEGLRLLKYASLQTN